MFGPLPPLHQLLVIAIGLVVGVGAGVWIGTHAQALDSGAAGMIGGAIGFLVALALVHEPHHDDGPPPIEIRRR